MINIKKSLLVILGLIPAILGSTAVIAAEPSEQDQRADVEWYPIADNVYQMRYEHHYTMFVVTSKGVVAFDPLSNEAAEHYVHAIKAAAPGQPLRAIIYSHWHTDHATGANVLRREFGEKVPIIAHERTLARLKDLDDEDIPLPTSTVSDKGDTLHYGDTDIELRYIGYGHTDTMLVARLPKQKMVYVVDFASRDSVGWREMPGWPLDELVAMQRRLLDLDFDKVAFGHGRAGPGDRETIKRQTVYYENLLTEARSAIKDGLSEDEAVVRVATNLPQYRGWGNYGLWFRLNVRGAYRWVQEREPN
ncbi:MAG: hypothetical protein BMS9Abin09_0141 [Gammaproteobacteria bacterium]|nr:MAG: hypothetical protein BMS9Abin09_0141 [Gammaproteobacteria bacterium]